MLFNSFTYIVFLIVAIGVYFLVEHRWRIWLLLAGSYFFYMCWEWKYAFLIAVQTLIHYLCGLYLQWERHPRRRQCALATAVAVSLGMLSYYKYSNFFIGSLERMAAGLGLHWVLPHLSIILPVGISFYCFQALGYTIDVYRGTVPAERHLSRFALYVAFFPQLVAGPIERAGHLLVQFRKRNNPDLTRFVSGSKLIVWGLFKKVVIADRLAFYVDRVYGNPDVYSGTTLLLATYFFAFQIYCDFSGYSDIAVGSARIFGYDLMQNFNLPYFATSVSDFWKRWHISLSTWFRDYVYVPLGGNRVSTLRWCFNIAVVFLLSGLWHGANWTFVAWGGIHGGYYLAEQMWRRHARGPVLERVMPAPAARVVRILLVFHLVLLAWVFFRAASLSQAGMILTRIATDLGGAPYLGPSQFTTLVSILLLGMLLLYQYMQAQGLTSLYVGRSRLPLPVRFTGYAGMILGMALLAVPSNKFIYFQF